MANLLISLGYDLIAIYVSYRLIKWEGVLLVCWLLHRFYNLEKR